MASGTPKTMNPEVAYFGREADKPALNVGSGPKYIPSDGWVNMERWPDPRGHTAARKERVRYDLLADAHILPFKPASFATVYFRQVLEHLNHPLAALREAYRVLEVGGLVRVEVPNPAVDPDEKDTHLYSWTPQALQQIVKFVRFEDVEWIGPDHKFAVYEETTGNNHGVEGIKR